MRLELGWQGIGGFYFTRLFEAYNACLRAHRPVSFVFTEDCRPDLGADEALAHRLHDCRIGGDYDRFKI